MRLRWLATAVIVTVLPGCDNVTWGGIDAHLTPPPAKGSEPVEAPAEAAAEGSTPLPALPDGPVLLAGRRDGSTGTLTVVGELAPGGLVPLPSEEEAPGFAAHFSEVRLAPGTEFVLFSEGVRVGRLTATETGTDARFCGTRPTVTGVVELRPGATGAQRLLALPVEAARDRGWEAFRSLQHDYDQRVASLALAGAAIGRVGAPWPPSVLEARADVQALRMPDDPGASVAATFLFQDALSIAPAGRASYALFVLGTNDGADYQPAYTWYQRVDDGGKAAPRYFNHLDWDGDGRSEVLLDVFGAERRWFAAITRQDGRWLRSFEDGCGADRTPTG
jgi:hypothetical protein